MLKRILLILIVSYLLIVGSTVTAMVAIDNTPARSNAVSDQTGPVESVARAQKKEERQEETVYITRTGEKFHRESCRYLSRSKIPIKRKDAVARGYGPCKVCNP